MGPSSFVYGWKDQYGSPEGLFDAASKGEGEQNVIYVCFIYPLPITTNSQVC